MIEDQVKEVEEGLQDNNNRMKVQCDLLKTLRRATNLDNKVSESNMTEY